ncbi:MAG: T9SS type A sorting domain-containing protein [Bacteroidales bacterium]|nr:T9SS type A sorting domain-containing protein [Bacteroidales bacterium]
MRKYPIYVIICFIGLSAISAISQNLPHWPKITPAGKGKVNTYIDNMGYWDEMARMGYVEVNPWRVIPKAIHGTSMIQPDGMFVQDSPDVAVTASGATTQSENSIFIDPEDESILINSNNSSDWNGSYAQNLYGCDRFWSFDAASTWGGSIYGVGQANNGDPATAIGRNGWYYVGKINNGRGQSVAYSTNQGQNWTDVPVAQVSGGFGDLLDKNHLWIDNSETSPYQGYLYAAWSCYVDGSPNQNQIEIARSTNQGISWSIPIGISEHVNAGKHNQGVNIQTGPNGEVYAAWIIYDTWPSDETAIGFAKSLDGGETWVPGNRILTDIKGIRASGTSKDMRVASFPVMTVDLSNGPNQGNLYIVWANIGVPGLNTGNDIDIYMISSSNLGDTWSTPIRVNQDPSGLGKQHFLPWVTCDPTNGNLCVIYYDDRNVDSTMLETWVSYSYDAGNSWTDFKVSDVAFTPVPIAGMAADYFGDYIGIKAQNMKVYPIWTDNRAGNALAYVSAFDLGPPPGQPYVSYYSNELTGIPGGIPQPMNFGDSLHLSLGLKNIGDQPAENLTAVISVASPFISLTDSTEDYGTLEAEEIKIIPNGYAFKVSDTIPDGIKVKFTVTVTSSDTSWQSHFSIESHAPSLRVTRLVIDDESGGNNNGKLDPGETAQVRVTTANWGDFPCLNTYGLLSCASPYITIHTDSSYLDTIVILAPKTAVFSLSVDDEAPTGVGLFLDYRAVSGLYHADASFMQTIGIVVEDWETNSFNKFPWRNTGNKPWTITTVNPYEGIYCAVTFELDDYQASILDVDYTAGVDDSISFYRRVSSEPDYDFLHFYIDGNLQGSWSGDVNWGRIAFPVSAGTHNFKWRYAKDIFLGVGLDKAWVDFIDFPPPILPEINAGPDGSACNGSSYQLNGMASGQDSLLWTTKGDGTFNNDTILNPLYYPGANDILSGEVKLLLRGFVEFGSAVSSLMLTIGESPEVAILVDPKDTLCSWQSGTLSTQLLPGLAYIWSPGGNTAPSIAIDTSVAGGIGTTWFKVTATNSEGCSTSDSVEITFKDCTAIDELADRFSYSVSPNPTSGEFDLRIHSPEREVLSFRILSSGSQVILEEKEVVVSGNVIRHLDIRHLASGIYFLEIDRRSGKTTEKIILVK